MMGLSMPSKKKMSLTERSCLFAPIGSLDLGFLYMKDSFIEDDHDCEVGGADGEGLLLALS